MVKLFSIISLVLAIVLFPPAALALVSNNAVPGDATYPIKRALEDGIFAVASLNPTTKAWFAAARSDRRFKEFTTLVAQGKKGGETLNELVEQTQVAANQIAQVNDEGQKQQLIEQLSQSIKKYDLGLQQVSSSAPSDTTPFSYTEAVRDLPQVTAGPVQSESAPQQPTPVEVVSRPTIRPQPGQTLAPAVHPTPRPIPAPGGGAGSTSTSQPTPAPTTPTPIPRPTPAPTPRPADADRQRQIDEARKKLEEIKKKLEEEQKQRLQNQQNHSNSASQVQQQQSKSDAKDNQQERQQGKQNDNSKESKESKSTTKATNKATK